jgi:CheY-like chemotaxis protein
VPAAQRVLVVDGLAETEAVLRAVLEPRGLEVDRVRGAGAGAFASKCPPSVVVLHLEDGPAQIPPPHGWQDVPRILIGATHAADRPRPPADEHYLEKPFQYGELIRTIERLLAAAAD